MLRQIIAAALVVVIPATAQWAGWLDPLENQLIAARMEMRPTAPTGSVVVVDIDEKSISAIGVWPWPRRLHADLVDKLFTLGAAEVALDIDFSRASNPADDDALEAALKRAHGGVTLSAFVQKQSAQPNAAPVYNRPLGQFADNAWVGSVAVRPDADGLVRRFGYGLVVDGRVVPSVPALLAGGLGEAGRSFLVDFGIDLSRIDRVSFIDVLRGNVDASRIAGKRVIVGAQAVELRDFFTVSVHGVVPGALLQAAAAETLLQGRAIHESSLLVMFAGLLFLSLTAFAIGRGRWWLLIGFVAGMAVLIEAMATLVQAKFAFAVNTAPLHMGLAILAIIVLLSEIDLGELLRTVLNARAKNAQSLLNQVVTDNFAGFVVIDEDGLILAASRTAAELLGQPFDLTGSRARDVLPSELSANVDAVFAVNGFERTTRRSAAVSVRRRDGERRLFEHSITVSTVESERADGVERKVACLTFADVTEQRAEEARIAHMARFDSLTDLPNRNQLIERVSAAFASQDSELRSSAIVCFDLDGFKKINDTLGHHFGDQMLRAVAERATQLLPAGGLVARLGGDEFAAIFSGRAASDDAIEFATRAVAAISKPFQLGGHQAIISASAGVALADSRDKGADDILMRADVALYRAKTNGGSQAVVFERRMLASVVQRQRLEFELWQALDRGEFEVWYQPQSDLSTDQITGMEALLRWRHPERGLVSPAEFIPVAEAIGLIDKLGQWVLESACAEAATWPETIKLAVNVSSAQFARSDMAEIVSRALAHSGLPASRLDLEITESLFMQPSKTVHAVLEKLRAIGVGIALDDFGTGYSSLGYIQRFPITKIKLDQSFVAGLPANTGSAAIVRAVAGIARDVGLRLIAEGVESEAQATFLASLGVDEGQGYLYGRPQAPHGLVRLLQPSAEVFRLRA
jgi:diguanylate cyclase (GGDEF)-like protein/PAS domain S-box-containing protein